jgi:hypothetical protein
MSGRLWRWWTTVATKTRIPNKSIWGTEDIIAECRAAESAWGKALERVKSRYQDPALILALAGIRDTLATIHRLAADARQGEYHGQGGAQ